MIVYMCKICAKLFQAYPDEFDENSNHICDKCLENADGLE